MRNREKIIISMVKSVVLSVGFLFFFVFCLMTMTWADQPTTVEEKKVTMSFISLPKPEIEKNQLMKSLNLRRTETIFGSKELTQQVLSDLLWAGFGVNREDGKRTAPSAMNWQEIDIYVIMESGAYVYDPKENTLMAVAVGDLRSLAGQQAFVATAPLNLIYVADYSKMIGTDPENQSLYANADTGFISQNVYLFCASEGLVTVVRGSVDRQALAEVLKLPDNKKITLAQTVGYPE